MMKTRLAAIAVALTVSAGVALAGAAPAEANFAWCLANKVCFSSDTNGNGTKWSYYTTEMRGGAAFPSDRRYIADAVYNRTDSDVTVYDNPRCWKGSLRIPAHTAVTLSAFHHVDGDLNGWADNPASVSSDGTAPPLGIGICGA